MHIYILYNFFLKWHNAFSYALGNLEVRCECMTWFFVKTDMVAKGISQDDISNNWVGRWANIIFRMRTTTVSECSSTNSIRRVVPYFY